MLFAKQLSVLIAADVSLLESLSMIRDQNRSLALSAILDDLIRDTQNGTALSKSLRKHQSMCGDFAIGVIAIGEASGTLSENLAYLADELKKRQLLKQKITSALLYPSIIILATLVLTGFLILYLFPKLMPIFLSLHMKLPLTTRIVIGVSQFLLHYGLILMLGLLCVGIGTIFLKTRYPKLRHAVTQFSMRVPFVSACIRGYNLAQSSRSLGLLLESCISSYHRHHSLHE